jgi:hypothetical protein
MAIETYLKVTKIHFEVKAELMRSCRLVNLMNFWIFNKFLSDNKGHMNENIYLLSRDSD